MAIKFGPAGIGGLKDAPEILKRYHKYGIKAAEIPFTYQVWIKNKEDANKIKKLSQEFDIELSIHAPYWINLNSAENKKIEESKKRILRCCEVADWLDVKRVVFHCGYYGKMSHEETFENIKQGIIKMLEIIKKNKWDVTLCPEIIGKKNVFGSIEEISRLTKESGCSFCIDFAHVLARYGKYKIEELKKAFPQKHWHCHFSGIEFGQTGEKYHKKTPEEEIKKLISFLPEDKSITVINESPSPIEDTQLALKILKKSEKY